MSIEEFATVIWNNEKERRRSEKDNLVFEEFQNVDIESVINEIAFNLKRIMNYDLEYVYSSLNNICYVGLIGPTTKDGDKCRNYHNEQLQKLINYSNLFKKEADNCMVMEEQLKEFYPDFGINLETKFSNSDLLIYQQALKMCHQAVLIACEGDSYVSSSDYSSFVENYQNKITTIYQGIMEKLDVSLIQQAIFLQGQFYISEVKEYLSFCLDEGKSDDLGGRLVAVH
ncbi:MAG: hypothetical protein E7168_01335 [Firmicutes bacterium]|nr:hypothetical protein [Bacillota bacterium]